MQHQKTNRARYYISGIIAAHIIYAHHVMAQTNTDTTYTLPPIIVAENDWDALSSPTAPISATRSIVMLDHTDLENRPTERIEEIAAYHSGITSSTQTGGTETSLFIRGYTSNESNTYLNGHKDNQRLFSRDLATVEEIDILKGHSSVVFGAGSPAGTIHYRTKRPQPHAATTLTATIGNEQKRRITLDTTGATRIPRLNQRLIVVGQESDTFMQNVPDDKQVVLGSLAWNYQPDNQLRLEVEYNRLRNPYSYGTVRVNGSVLYDQSYVDPRTTSDRRYLRSGLYWQHAINNDWKINAHLNHMQLNRDDLLMGFFYKLNENSLKGHWIDSDNHYWQLNTKLELIGNTHIANTQHHVTFGLASNEADNNLDAIRSTDFTLDPYAPSFDRPEPRDSAVFRGFHYRDKDNHVYIIDNMRLTEQLAITAGVRYSTFFNTNRLTNTVAVDKNALTSSLGASWQPHNNITLYGSYATSFEPNTGVSRQGDYFEPLEAEQLEAGLRWYPTSAITTEIALYDLTQQNLLTRDPIDPDYQTPTGARRSRGIEIDATLALDDAYQLQVAYSHNKNKYIEDFYGRLGKTASGIARNTGALRLHWQPPAQPNWNAYVGLIGVGKRYGDAANSFSLPGYGRLDAGIRYQDQQTTYRLNIENLMDKRYIAAAFADDDLYQGKRRMINASVSYRW